MKDKAVKGGLIFYGKGKCSSCHKGPYHTDFKFYSLPFPQAGFGKNGFGIDYGRYNVTHNPEDLYRFRTPPLINVQETFPYTHSGSIYDLDKVVIAHFDPLKNVDISKMNDLERIEYFRKLKSTDIKLSQIPYLDKEEIANLVEFLKTLSFVEK